MRAKREKVRIRKSTKYICIIVAVVLIIVSFGNLLKNTENKNTVTKTKQIYFYTNKYNYDYNTNLIPNKYIETVDKSNKNMAYITDLINNIDLELNYEYKSSITSNLKYDYEVIGKMQATYNKDGEEQKILEKEDVLLEKVSKEENTNNIKINDKLTLDLKQKNQLLNEFKQKIGITINADYTIMLKVHINTTVEEKDITVDYNPIITIDLAEKTTKISGENNKEDTQYVAKEYKQTSKNTFMVIVDIIGIIIAIYLFTIANKAQVTNRIKNEYRQELNRILKLCQDKIVQVSTKPETDLENTVYVKDFGEIVKLSEELFKPILYYFDQEKEEAWFSIMSNRISYRYILKK